MKTSIKEQTKKHSPLIEKNHDFIKDHGYEILSNGNQLYKKVGSYETLITDYSSRPFEADLWYIINIDVWIKESKTDIVVKRKNYTGNFFFPTMKKINRFIEGAILDLENSSK